MRFLDDSGNLRALLELTRRVGRRVLHAARIRADVLFHGLWRNADATNRRLAKQVLEGRCTWAEDGVLLLDDDAPLIADTTPGRSTPENVHHRIH